MAAEDRRNMIFGWIVTLIPRVGIVRPFREWPPARTATLTAAEAAFLDQLVTAATCSNNDVVAARSLVPAVSNWAPGFSAASMPQWQ